MTAKQTDFSRCKTMFKPVTHMTITIFAQHDEHPIVILTLFFNQFGWDKVEMKKEKSNYRCCKIVILI